MNSHSQSPNQRAQGTNGSADGVADPVFLETLLANEERLRLAVEATQLGILDFDPINGQQTLNAEALRLWGFSNDVNPTPERLLNAVHPDDRELLRSVTAESLNPHGSGRFSIEHRVIHPDGSLRWLSVSASTIFKGENENRRAVRSIGMMFDITERKLREEALQATEERLRARNKQLSFLARVSQLLILNDLPENELLTLVLNEAAATVGADTFLYYRAEDENTLRLHCCGGLAETERTPLDVVPIGGPLCGHVAQHRYPLVIENAAEGGNAASELLVAAGFRAYAGFPLIAGDRLLGTIAIITRSKSHFAEGEIQSLQTACEQISATLERLRLAHELRTSEERQRLAMEGAGLGLGMLIWFQERPFGIESTLKFKAISQSRNPHRSSDGRNASIPMTSITSSPILNRRSGNAH